MARDGSRRATAGAGVATITARRCLAGTDALRLGRERGEDVVALTAAWREQLARCRACARPYLRYR